MITPKQARDGVGFLDKLITNQVEGSFADFQGAIASFQALNTFINENDPDLPKPPADKKPKPVEK